MKKVVPLKDLPASVTTALRTLPTRMPRELQLSVETTAFRHYPQEEALLDLQTGQVLPAPVQMPSGFRGDEDYFVPANRIPLQQGIAYVANSGMGYATLQVVKPDFDILTATQPALPAVSREEWQALDVIDSTKASGRARYFKVLKLGAYSPQNPYVMSLVEKKLLTRAGSPTALGKSVRLSVHGYGLPSFPLAPCGHEECNASPSMAAACARLSQMSKTRGGGARAKRRRS